MREVLFKGKQKENNEWMEGSAIHQTDLYGTRVERWFILDGTDTNDYDIGFAYEVYPSTVCQHIGLTDKNGTKAFEMDKVYDPHENRVFTIYWDKETAAFCLLDDNGWMKKDISRLSYCEIIGNIHDKEE